MFTVRNIVNSSGSYLCSLFAFIFLAQNVNFCNVGNYRFVVRVVTAPTVANVVVAIVAVAVASV